MQKALELEKKGVQLPDLSQYLTYSFTDRTADKMLQTLIERGEPKQLTQSFLTAQSNLKFYSGDNDLVNKLVEMSSDRSFHLEDVAKFVKPDKQIQQDRVELIANKVKSNAPPKDFSYSRLTAEAQLRASFKADPEILSRVLALENPRAQLTDIADFAKYNRDTLIRLVQADNADAKPFDIIKVRDQEGLKELEKLFPENLSAQNYFKTLSKTGLSALKLAHFVKQSPGDRVPLIEKLIGEHADPETMNGVMHLSPFQPKVMEALAKSAQSGGMSVGQINGHLRSWAYGKSFLELVTDHINADKPVTKTAIEDLVELAKIRFR